MTDNLLTGDDNSPTIDPDKDYLPELIGVGGKFYDPDEKQAHKALARGKVEADLYIKTLTGRLDELRADYLKVRDENLATAKLQELINQMETKQKNSSSEPPLAKDEDKPGYDAKDIETIVNNKIKENKLVEKQMENFNIVSAKLKEKYGSNSAAILKEQANILGLTDDDVNVLARKSPEAFFRTMGLNEPDRSDNNFQTPPQSSRRADSFAPKTQKRTWSYYQELKKKDPKIYHDPKISVQMQKDVIELGEDVFYDS